MLMDKRLCPVESSIRSGYGNGEFLCRFDCPTVRALGFITRKGCVLKIPDHLFDPAMAPQYSPDLPITETEVS